MRKVNLTQIQSKKIKYIKYCDRNIMRSFGKILREIRLRLDELRRDFPTENL